MSSIKVAVITRDAPEKINNLERGFHLSLIINKHTEFIYSPRARYIIKIKTTSQQHKNGKIVFSKERAKRFSQAREAQLLNSARILKKSCSNFSSAISERDAFSHGGLMAM
jgi:hypothetical protein